MVVLSGIHEYKLIGLSYLYFKKPIYKSKGISLIRKVLCINDKIKIDEIKQEIMLTTTGVSVQI
jgi:hypothetical protein